MTVAPLASENTRFDMVKRPVAKCVAGALLLAGLLGGLASPAAAADSRSNDTRVSTTDRGETRATPNGTVRTTRVSSDSGWNGT